MKKFFLDSYAIIEIEKGNPNYKFLLNNPTITTFLNVMECYGYLLKNVDEKSAESMFETYYENSIRLIPKFIIKEAVKLKVKFFDKVSYIDCIGYKYAKVNNMAFVTGDDFFKGKENVLFLK